MRDRLHNPHAWSGTDQMMEIYYEKQRLYYKRRIKELEEELAKKVD